MNQPTVFLGTGYQPNRHWQAGRSILEVMIALSVGLIVVAALSGAFVSSQQTARQTNAAAKLTQDMTAAMDLLGSQIRQAGWGEIVSATRRGDSAKRLSLPVIHGCDGSYSTTGLSTQLSGEASMFNCTGTGASDSFTVGQQVEAANCTGSAATSYYNSNVSFANTAWGKDILGQCVQAVADGQGSDPVSQVLHRFFIHTKAVTAANPNPRPALYASTSANNVGQPMIPDLEQMKLRYLIGKNGTGEGNLYMYAANVTEENQWKNVVGVRVCIMMSTEDRNIAPSSSGAQVKLKDCTDTEQTFSDGRLRKVSSSLYLLRNRATPISHNRTTDIND